MLTAQMRSLDTKAVRKIIVSKDSELRIKGSTASFALMW